MVVDTRRVGDQSSLNGIMFGSLKKGSSGSHIGDFGDEPITIVETIMSMAIVGTTTNTSTNQVSATTLHLFWLLRSHK